MMAMDALAPLTQEELEIRREVFRTKNPERRHMVNVYFYIVDESESWYYEFIWLFLCYFALKLNDLMSPVVFMIVIGANLTFSLCLYELTLNTISKTRLFKFFVYLVGMGVQYFTFCDCSELVDTYQDMFRLSILQSDWHSISTQSRRDLCIVLAQLQRPCHFRFYNGFFVVSRAFFLKVVKTAYTFVNFMRIRNL
ncbi:hypothetical protein WDU94_007091 [Cyamophila willieti]